MCDNVMMHIAYVSLFETFPARTAMHQHFLLGTQHNFKDLERKKKAMDGY